jgi:hypothetical protein
MMHVVSQIEQALNQVISGLLKGELHMATHPLGHKADTSGQGGTLARHSAREDTAMPVGETLSLSQAAAPRQRT